MTTESVNIRELVLEILLSVTRDETYSHMAISSVLDKYQYLTKQERSFITRVSEGTLENMIELDYIISLFSSVKINKMKPVIRTILRMGVYQMKYMDSVPASAACNEAVKLAQKKGFANLKGFVNGVLRNISRNIDTVEYPDELKDMIYAWSIRYSIPRWMIEQWCRDYGESKTKSILEAFRLRYGITVRVNRMKTTAEKLKEALHSQGILAETLQLPEYPDYEDALLIAGFDYLGGIEEFVQGHFTVQDISSMLVALTAEPNMGDYVLDVCAAPGGKCLHVAEMLRGTGTVEARDLTEYKVSLIEDNIKRTGLYNIKAVQSDACIYDIVSKEKADIVIADLPCSGLGVLRKKTDIRYKMTAEKEKSLSILQREMLSNVCDYVKYGGTLMYSTCTINKMENEENTAWFLIAHPEFELVKERQIFPDEGNGDGFYIAKFLRQKRAQ